MYKQDLHIHTVFSKGDKSVAPEQTLELIARFRHARVMGISDHFHQIEDVERYFSEVRLAGFRVGTEISNLSDAYKAIRFDFEYFLLHCRNEDDYYKAADLLLETGKPLIIAHPISMKTDLNRISPKAYVEFNNHYVWMGDWMGYYAPYKDKFRFVAGSDAHQPHWLNQEIAQRVMKELGLDETIIFPREES